MNGIALTVLISQLPKFSGFPSKAKDRCGHVGDRQGILEGKINWAAFALGAGASIVSCCSRTQRVPGILIAVIGATVIVLSTSPLATGSRSLAHCLRGCLLSRSLDRLCRHCSGPDRRLRVALMSFADTSVLSRAYAARRQERRPQPGNGGAGAANLAAGFFQGFPISSSSSRTPVAEAAGARTQLTGVVGALAVAVLLLMAPDLLSICRRPHWPRW